MKRIPGEWRYFDEQANMPYPWYTRPCLEYLEIIDFSNKTIFEYGVGDSTKWFRAKGAMCYGVDNDFNWAQSPWIAYVPDNESDYINSVYELIQLDIIVIDGLFRDKCTEHALKSLKPGGALIIDNYKQKSADLEHWPLTEKLIEGMDVTYYKEPDHQDWQTIVVRK